MISITAAAADQIKAVLAENDEESQNLFLRIAARETSDGVEFGMGLDEVRDQDMNFNCEGVQVLLGPTSRNLLAGVTLDYVEYQPGEYRFIFIPPSSCGTRSGGCGGCGSAGGCGSGSGR